MYKFLSNVFRFYPGIMIAMVMIFLPVTVHAGTFTDDFDDGNADGWTIAENAASEWQVVDGGYHGSIADATESIALIGADDWNVKSIEVNISDVQGEWLALIWNYRDLNNFDSWWLNVASSTIEAWPKVGAYEGSARVTAAVSFDPAEEFTLEVIIQDNDFDVLFDGEKMGRYSNDAFDTGKVGLLVWAGSATFDDAVITGPNIIGNLAVSLSEKTTAFWGRLKTQ